MQPTDAIRKLDDLEISILHTVCDTILMEGHEHGIKLWVAPYDKPGPGAFVVIGKAQAYQIRDFVAAWIEMQEAVGDA